MYHDPSRFTEKKTFGGVAVLVNGAMCVGVDKSHAMNRVGTLIELFAVTSDRQDALGALGSLTTTGAAAFNARFPAGVPTSACGNGAASAGGIRFFSLAGARAGTNAADVSDLLLMTERSGSRRRMHG